MLTKISNLKPVSIENKKGLTKGQQMLYELLVQKAKDEEILTRDNILKLWLSVDKRYHRTWKYHGWDAGRSPYQAATTTELTIETAKNYGYMSNAIQWFKSNLAACIIKGKILAIPIIQIDEEKQIKEK